MLVLWRLTLPIEQRQLLSLIYPHSSDFIRACLISLPVLLVLAALTQRVPFRCQTTPRSGQGILVWYSRGRRRFLLLLVCSLDLYGR